MPYEIKLLSPPSFIYINTYIKVVYRKNLKSLHVKKMMSVKKSLFFPPGIIKKKIMYTHHYKYIPKKKKRHMNICFVLEYYGKKIIIPSNQGFKK